MIDVHDVHHDYVTDYDLNRIDDCDVSGVLDDLYVRDATDDCEVCDVHDVRDSCLLMTCS
jgi:hypothetical protein